MTTVREQIRTNVVALISLVVALTSLGYNTWRNEQTEANRNVRNAGIAFLLKLGQLEETVFFIRYDSQSVEANPRIGWAYVLTARDLANLTLEPAIGAAEDLFVAWDENWQALAEAEAAGDAVSGAIDHARRDMLQVLANLD